jgi:beta-1,2-mannobiose phosphorylase / 1,2-beta-oligomannan phosphorylase
MLVPKDSAQTAETDEPTHGARVERLGIVMSPDGERTEAGGILNPAAARGPERELLLYPRCVARGNVSRVGTVFADPSPAGIAVSRSGFALEPQAPYERRQRGGYGCEDPRVTYIPVLKAYVMAYTAFGPDGPRVAFAISDDAYRWERLGLAHFEGTGTPIGDDKDAAFFPEPVTSPSGVRCLAFYHRPMLHLSALDGRAAIPMIERLPYEERESIRIAYVPLDAVLKDRKKLLDVTESVEVLSPDGNWGSIKIGAGTPPVRIAEGWMSLFHGVDSIGNHGRKPLLTYSSGIVVHDLERPDRIVYRSRKPIISPETEYERKGAVDNVVFPTGMDPRPDLGERVFDFYYGAGDWAIGGARMWLDDTLT